MRIGNFKKAINIFIHIINLDNKNTTAYNNLGNAFKSIRDYTEAKKNYEKALKIDPKYINAIVNYGNLYFEINDYTNAIHQFEKAVKINEMDSYAYYNLALVYQSLGDFEKSKINLKKVQELNPINTKADKLLSRITKYSIDHSHINEMEKKLTDIKLNDYQKINLYFALAKAYEDIKDYKSAFKYMKIGNDTKKRLIKYNLSDDKKTFSKLKEFFKEFEFKNQNKINKNKKIIFIVGLPRSGTSLVEQIISTHSKVYGCGELDYMTRIINENLYSENVLDTSKLQNLSEAQIKNIGKKYLEFVDKFSPDSVIFTDKAPLNFIWIGIIKILIPDSKIVHCIRDPKDNILSLYKNDFDDRLNFTYNFNDLFEFYKEYFELMKCWKSKFSDHIFDVDYEKMIKNPENEIKDLLNFCDLEFEKECMNFHNTKRLIKTVSSAQARQPIYNSSLSAYKNYEVYMNEIFQKLENID
jgi:Tfp pilus assembly protein PilF